MWLLRVWARKTLKQRWLSWKSWAPCAWFLAATRRFCRPCCTTRSMPAKGPAFRWALWQLPLCLCCFELCLHKHLCRLAGSTWLDVSRCWLLSCHFKHSLPLKVKFQRIEYTFICLFCFFFQNKSLSLFISFEKERMLSSAGSLFDLCHSPGWDCGQSQEPTLAGSQSQESNPGDAVWTMGSLTAVLRTHCTPKIDWMVAQRGSLDLLSLKIQPSVLHVILLIAHIFWVCEMEVFLQNQYEEWGYARCLLKCYKTSRTNEASYFIFCTHICVNICNVEIFQVVSE